MRLNLILTIILISFVTAGCSDESSAVPVSQDNTSIQSVNDPIPQNPNASISYTLRMFE
jgi:multisubunit Na+/H+ antiporter MnhC subunit